MRWRHVPGDPDSATVDGDQDRVVIDGLEGEGNALALVAEIARFYAEGDVRAGYALRLSGDCNKGPQGVNWGPLEIVLEHDPASLRLRDHLEATWGAQGVHHPRDTGADEMGGLIHWL